MQITNAALRALGQGFQASFLRGIESVAVTWPLVAMEVQSRAKLENYGWMKDLPGMREWIGDRVIHNLEATNYQLINKHFEHTIGVDRDDIEDDQLGIYSNRFAMQGEIAAQKRDPPIYLPGVFRYATLTNGKVHITQKPEKLMDEIIQICPPDGLIYDPFMGSGTTGVSALKSGRKFVGCETVEQYFITALNRCEKAVS